MRAYMAGGGVRLGLLLVMLAGSGCSADSPSPTYGSGQSGSGGSGGTEGGTGFESGVIDVFNPDAPPEETSVVEGGYDVQPDVALDASCSDAPPPAAEIQTNLCATATDNECDGTHDPPNMQGHTIPNGNFGNGYDDDCDGLVDEGCSCDPAHDVGSTKDCYLMPSSWTDDTSKLPVGWCAQNSKGTVRCAHMGGTAEQPLRLWDGECRGASPPWPDDVCANGDFNCDGVEMNAVGKDCGCVNEPVQCPLEPLKMNPFPNPSNLTQKDAQNPLVDPAVPFIINGHDWIDDAMQGQATGWQWELTGGDCDNILPHPTFAIYAGSDGLSSSKLGTQQNNLGPNGNQHGLVTSPSPTQNQVFPAFSLSGDYILKGQFSLAGVDYECSVKIQVRAPGIRAELCWDNVGEDGSNDVDLHFARMQGNDSCTQHGWFLACGSAPKADDCYYASSSGCPGGLSNDPGWGYGNSHNEACHGWGSLRDDVGSSYTSPCTNPRLDRDNIECVPSQSDPNGWPTSAGEFCGPENINLDNPNPGDRFVVGVQCYDCVNSGHPKTHPHVNVYCNGERMLSAGYDPSQPAPHFPALVESGETSAGSFWTAAYIGWKGDANNPCRVEGVPSEVPNPTTDGSVNYCVEDGPRNAGSGQWLFQSGGGLPGGPGDACWH